MSKIFEALRKAGAETSEITQPLFDGEQIRRAEPEAAVEAWEEPPSALKISAAAPFSESPAAEPPVPLPGLGSRIRTLPIRIPAGVPVLPFDGSHRRGAEQYRIIRTRIAQQPRPLRMLVVSSAGPGDGKTISALNIAGAFALKNDANVLLVDADFRRSNVAELLGIPAEPGLADVLSGARTIEDAIVRVEQFPNLYVAPAGKLSTENNQASPAELLDSPRWRSVASVFRKEFGFTILDTPPIGAVADYDLIRVVSDGVILVVRPDHTNRTQCFRALEAVPKTQLIGVVVNCTEEWFLRKTHDYYESCSVQS